MPRDPRRRFSDRVADYVRARPGYPPELLDWLRRSQGLAAGQRIADVGCGTGNLAEPFLDAGHEVIGIEPNAEMREAGRSRLAGRERFRAVEGAAEATGLADRSMDWVVAGQAFHWFDVERSRTEFRRILRTGGRVLLVWNDRDVEASPMMRAYEGLLDRFGTDYRQVNHQRYDEAVLRRFFAPRGHAEARFAYRQDFDREGLAARLLSSSYAPAPGTPGHEPMMAALDDLFRRHAVDGRVGFVYRTRALVGRMDDGAAD